MKHYRVGRQGPGYLIEVENPISCSSLCDVVSCFIEKTDRTLVPFILQEDYEHSISFVQSDRDSGEDTVQRARAISTPKPPLPPKKPAPLKPPVCLKPKPSQRPPSESTATVKPLLPQQSQPNEVLLHSVTEELREKLLQRRGYLS
ncbi:Signal-transducing adaptor protein 2 [Acipenser ruthenus]|uniref:Signal-transducing adaptor protein 2 n=1 Tax=Acipenser ruthenus TaxID=7906 RepID=A0A444UWK9_ACIRT|nr:Signal-transducing adaptor protein 2 [Acipenser ruthenus]